MASPRFHGMSLGRVKVMWDGSGLGASWASAGTSPKPSAAAPIRIAERRMPVPCSRSGGMLERGPEKWKPVAYAAARQLRKIARQFNKLALDQGSKTAIKRQKKKGAAQSTAPFADWSERDLGPERHGLEILTDIGVGDARHGHCV